MLLSRRIHLAVLVLAVAAAACASPAAPTFAPSLQAGTNTPEAKTAESETPHSPAAVVPTPTILYQPHGTHVWNGIPSIVIVTRKGDPRIAEVMQAVQFWNDQLKSMGTPFRLGAVTESYDINPDDLVPPKFRIQDPSGDPGPTAEELPQLLASVHADIIITLTSFDISSRNIFDQKNGQLVPNGRDLIIIKNFQASVPSKSQTGAIKHELGHAVGLSHDSYNLSVMCGPPWMDLCKERLMVLDSDQQFILSRYPPTWTPAP
jgi:hypothetical protein